MARRVEMVEDLSTQLSNDSAKLYPLKCDVSVEEEVLQCFEWIEENLGGISIMINNAGVLYATTLSG